MSEVRSTNAVDMLSPNLLQHVKKLSKSWTRSWKMDSHWKLYWRSLERITDWFLYTCLGVRVLDRAICRSANFGWSNILQAEKSEPYPELGAGSFRRLHPSSVDNGSGVTFSVYTGCFFWYETFVSWITLLKNELSKWKFNQTDSRLWEFFPPNIRKIGPLTKQLLLSNWNRLILGIPDFVRQK